MKNIIICADDYGQNPEISKGILALINQRRLTATSCMTNSPYWPEFAEQLKTLREHVDLGLHFNLTEGRALAQTSLSNAQGYLSSLRTILLKSTLRQLDKAAIQQELNAQLDAFVTTMGFEPDYIDGHQHVHMMPVIRNVIIETFKKRFTRPDQYLRCVTVDYSTIAGNVIEYIKKFVIQCSGVNAFKKLLQKNNIPHNQDFAGIYHFGSSQFFPTLFQHFLKYTRHGGLIMCHPGTYNAEASLPSFRLAEFQYLSSEHFLQDCREHQVKPVRFRDV